MNPTPNQKFKIIPVLVIVAMMAFSVRLVDFVTGVSSLTGAAFAKSTGPEEEAHERSATSGETAD